MHQAREGVDITGKLSALEVQDRGGLSQPTIFDSIHGEPSPYRPFKTAHQIYNSNKLYVMARFEVPISYFLFRYEHIFITNYLYRRLRTTQIKDVLISRTDIIEEGHRGSIFTVPTL